MKWGLVLLAVILILGFLIIRSDIFTIRSVDIGSEKIVCTNSEKIKNASKLLGQNLFLISTSKVKNAIKKKFLCIKDVALSRIFPNKISIFVSGREGKVLLMTIKKEDATVSASLKDIATPSAERLEADEGLEVDEDGVIFAKKAPTFDLPRIYVHSNLALGQIIPDTIFNALKVLDKVRSYGLDVSISEILDGWFMTYEQLNTPRIIFKLEENLDAQLASLQLILNQAKIDENQLEFIDLRFDKPVLRLAPKKN